MHDSNVSTLYKVNSFRDFLMSFALKWSNTGSVLQCFWSSWQQFVITVSSSARRDPDCLGSLCWRLCKRSVQHVLRKQKTWEAAWISSYQRWLWHFAVKCSSHYSRLQVVHKAAFLRALFEAQGEVNPMDDADDDGLPGNQVSEPIEQLPIQNMCLLPAGRRQRN